MFCSSGPYYTYKILRCYYSVLIVIFALCLLFIFLRQSLLLDFELTGFAKLPG